MHLISNILANPALVVKKKRTKKQNRMVNGETYILGIEDRHLPHEVGPACPPLHDFCLGCHSTVPGGQLSVCKQKRAVGCAHKDR